MFAHAEARRSSSRTGSARLGARWPANRSLTRGLTANARMSASAAGEGEVGVHLGLDAGDVVAVGGEATVVVAVLAPVELALEVVVAGRALGVAVGLAAVGDDLLDPRFLGLRRRVDRLVAVRPDVVDAVGDVI